MVGREGVADRSPAVDARRFIVRRRRLTVHSRRPRSLLHVSALIYLLGRVMRPVLRHRQRMLLLLMMLLLLRVHVATA